MHSTLRRFAALVLFAAAIPVAAASLRSPYRPASSAAPVPAAGEQMLDLDLAALAALRTAGEGSLDVAGFPTAPGAVGRLVLRRFDVASPGAHLRITGPQGDRLAPLPAVAHFRGRVEGRPDSLVYLAATDSQMVAWIRSDGRVAYVGPNEARTGHVVRDSDSPANDVYREAAWRCSSEELPQTPVVPARAEDRISTQPSLASKAGDAPDIAGFQSGGVIVETDQELLSKFGADQDAMAAYLLTLFGQANVIYERDLQVHLSVSEVHVWTVADPWDGPSPLDQLHQLGDWYHANRPTSTFPRATAFLLSGIAVQGGVAWVPGLCVSDVLVSGHWAGGYGITQIFANYPAQQWDLYSTTHEIGHNAGSVHTHCYVPPIDECYSGEAGCYSGPTSVPPGGGTIMSYCHLLPGGEANVNLVFHQRCIDEQMLPFVQSQSCFAAEATFADVPASSPFFHYVETIYQLGITGGCSAGNYCPGNPVSRQQMAVFLLKASFGSGHVPPACTGTVFGDVPCTGGAFDPWIEELANLGIAGGCGGGLFCPTATVTRKQMAPFLLKTLFGSSHVPPTPTGIFQDVPVSGNPFAPFIEELYALGITGGCQTSPLRYCPDNPNTRAQMAVFLTKTFHLAW